MDVYLQIRHFTGLQCHSACGNTKAILKNTKIKLSLRSTFKKIVAIFFISERWLKAGDILIEVMHVRKDIVTKVQCKVLNCAFILNLVKFLSHVIVFFY